PNGFLASKNS
ncbi:phage family protein, partial [Vibrio parahaemolyticus AQ3810]